MRTLHTVVSFLLLVVVGGCGGSSRPTSGQSGRPLTTIKVGIMPIPDCATVPAAELKGYFQAEGLRVERVIVQGGGIAMPKLQNGELQFAIMNYVAAIQKEAVAPGTIKLVTDAYQAAPNAFVLMVPGDSPIKSVSDLRGKRISVLTLNSVGTLSLEAALKVAGLTEDDVHVSEMQVTEMSNALQKGRIDAAWMTEPFITGYGLSGGIKLADMMDGQTEDLPIAGWATSGEFARANPGTVAAFQRAMLRAQADVASDRRLVTSLLPTYTKIDKNAANSITIGVFPLDLAPSRIQKVADLMREYSYITQQVDVTKLLLPLPAIPTPAISTPAISTPAISTPPSASPLPSSPRPQEAAS